MTTDLHIDIRTAAGAAREAVESLTPTERATALAHALELERNALAEERDSLRARLADLEAAMGRPKRTRAPRQPSESITTSDLRTLALSALDQPRTVDEVAKAVRVSRGLATEALDDLVTDGRARKVRAGRGWRFERTAADAKEDGRGLRIAATAAERRRIMSEESNGEYDLEDVYDEQIAPLMTRIIAICKEHKMPMVATFQYQVIDDGAVDPDPHWCTTVLQWADRGLAGKAKDAANAVNPNRRPPAMVLKTLDASGAVTAVEVVMP